jgi:hypothetical protein
MQRLVSLAVGIPFGGRAYLHLDGTLLHGARRLDRCTLCPCNVFQGYRTRSRAALAKQWERGPNGFVRRADPCLPGPYIHYGWQAPAVKGGACGGLLFPLGLCDHFGLRLRLRHTRSLLLDQPLCLYYKVGLEAPCGIMGTRLVPPKLWCPLPPECLQSSMWLSSDKRFWNVELRWVSAGAGS